jgi:multicomponent Na+:H+ antiporter subunit B
MNSVIFRTLAPAIFAVMLVFSVFVLLRGHNEPGGGFIGGLIAASAAAIYAMAAGVDRARAALKADPLAFAGLGVLLAAASGLLSLGAEASFMTGLWTTLDLGEGEVALSTPMLFDVGVYLVVFGTIASAALALQDDKEVD